MTENRRPHVIVLRLAAVLLVLVMLTTCMISGRYARYITTVTASDSARVARFSVTENTPLTSQNVPVTVAPGGATETMIEVSNDSEVAVRYRVEIDNPYENLPLRFQVKVAEGATVSLPFEGDMAPGAEATYVLVTTWEGAADVSYAGKVDLVEISLSAVQID